MKTTFFFVLIFFVMFSLSFAADVTLMWDANDPAPEGYRLFVHETGQEFDYASPAWQGITSQATITDLAEGIEYHFVCRAFDGENESGNSNEVIYTPEALPETLRYPRRPKTLIIEFE